MSIETVPRPADADGSTNRHSVSSGQWRKEANRGQQPSRVESVASAAQRSEAVLEEQARTAFNKSSYYAVRRAACDVCNGVLILRGRVPSFYLKQVAQIAVRDVLDGALVLDNQLEVDQT